jgi:N-acetylglutamate synthase-like GNAT family acetyltransferase
MVLRNFQPGDQSVLLDLVNDAYRNLETLTEEHAKHLLSPLCFEPKGFFIAEERDKPVGCIGVFKLAAKNRFDIRYLAVKKACSNISIIHRLIDAAVDYSTSRKCETLKAITLATQPYVEAYQKFGFKPIRRILRIAWDPIRICKRRQVNPKVRVTEVSEAEVEEASQVFADGVQPYWNWWVKEKGGKKTLQNEAADAMRQTPWLAAKVDDRIVGVTGVTLRPESGEASFSGVIVLPSFRKTGVGTALMTAALKRTIQMGYRRLTVHTMAYLDTLAPGAILYLKSGGKIEAEYLHLVRKLPKTRQGQKGA